MFNERCINTGNVGWLNWLQFCNLRLSVLLSEHDSLPVAYFESLPAKENQSTPPLSRQVSGRTDGS